MPKLCCMASPWRFLRSASLSSSSTSGTATAALACSLLSASPPLALAPKKLPMRPRAAAVADPPDDNDDPTRPDRDAMDVDVDVDVGGGSLARDLASGLGLMKRTCGLFTAARRLAMRDRPEMDGARCVVVVVVEDEGEGGRGTTLRVKGAKLAVEVWVERVGREEGASGEACGEYGWSGETLADRVGCTPAVVTTGPRDACGGRCAYGSEWSNWSGCEWIGSAERGAGGPARKCGPAGAE